MPHIALIDPDDATGLLREEYEAALARAGSRRSPTSSIVEGVGVGPEPNWEET